MSLIPRQNLKSFIEAVYQRVEVAIGNLQFDSSGQELLKATLNACHQKAQHNPQGDVLAIFYLIVKSSRDELGEQAEQLGVFCLLYILALDLFDDVQDEDLAGKPHEQAGAAIAINSALTLFVLGLKALHESIQLEPDVALGFEYLKVFHRVALLASSGQYKDLMGAAGALSPESVLAMQQAKTSSLSLVAECAALFARCDQENIKRYRFLSEQLCQLLQVVDDTRDIFGKRFSPDLATKKITYPLACFLEMASADQKAQYEKLIANLPSSLKEIRALIYNSRAIKRCAETIERLRLSIHDELAATGNTCAAHRTLLHIVDTLAGSLYVIPAVESSRSILQPEGLWHQRVKELALELTANLKAFNPPPVPLLLPWHLPQWMYDPKRKAIYYPDLEEQPEEIIPLQAAFMQTEDLEAVRSGLISQAPVIMAHEFFHYWRDFSGNLTRDYWFEEWAANRLAIAYVKIYYPELIAETLALANQVLKLYLSSMSHSAQQILEKFFVPGYKGRENPTGYEVNLTEIALIQLAMCQRLYAEELSLEQAVCQFLAVRGLISS
ncbi:hypothetical protein A6770_35065 [Nostoc minutum NIES-26]|uniref:Uncharacterized protein n=1 Tax=Nostoc minutum NIES-26 TaxID=1844469 RepID=A0A367S2B7_9NOSO|nr:hypothetical protein A6770_35065 [Nostoc minutum NIES-26]